MSGSLGEAVLDLAADSAGMLKDINEAKPEALSALDKLGKAGGALLAAGLMIAATAIVAITTMVWNAGNTLDEAYDKIQQRTGATGDALAGLQADFDAVFTSVPASADDAAVAISILNQRLGLTGPALQETSSALLELTRMTGGDLLTNGEALTRMIGDWGIASEDSASALDSVFVASQKTGTSVDRLMQLVVQFGAPMRSFGFSFEQSIAMLGKWEKEGVNTELVMGSLRIAAGNFARDNVPLQDGLKKTFDAIKNAKDASEALEIAMDVFGAKAGPDMAAAIRENRFELGDLVPMIENADGAIMQTAQDTMDWGERWTMFKNQMTTALGPAGLGLMDAVSAGLQAIVDVISRPDVQAGLMSIVNGIVSLAQQAAAALPGIIDGFFQFVQFLQNNQGVVFAILAAIGVAIGAFVYTTVIPAAIAMISAMAPILLIMAAVAAVAYLVYEAWTNNWGGIRDAVMQFWAVIQPYFQQLVDWLQINVPIALQALANWWTTVALPAIQAFFGFIAAEVIPRLIELVQWLAVNVPAGIQTLVTWWNTLKANVIAVWTAISTTITSLMAKIGISISIRMYEIIGYFNHFKEVADRVQVFIQSKLTQAWDGLAKTIGKVVNFIEDVIDAMKKVGSALPPWLIPGSPTPFEIGLWGVNDALKAMARASLPALGGSFQSNLAFSPAALSSGNLLTDGASAGSSRQYVFNMGNTVLDEDQLRRALSRAEVLNG